ARELSQFLLERLIPRPFDQLDVAGVPLGREGERPSLFRSADRFGFYVKPCEMPHQLLGLIPPSLARILRKMDADALTVLNRRAAQLSADGVRRPLAALHILDVIDPIRINADLRAAGKRATALCGSQVPRATASQVRWSGVDGLDLVHLEEFA